MAVVTPVSWAKSLLQSLEVPLTNENIQIITGWEAKEGGAGPQFGIANNVTDYNPLNSAQYMPRTETEAASTDTPGNTPPIQAYSSWSQGLRATVINLNNGDYTALLDMLQRGDATPTQAANAISSSPWGTGSENLASLIANAGSSPASGPVHPGQISGAIEDDNGLTIPAVRPGGAAGLAGTGTPGDSTQVTPFYVGDSTNPDQDYWTTINQYAQEAQLYFFSDGESMFLADGIKLMAQRPALVIHRADPRVLSFNLTYDNTSWMYAVTRRRAIGVQRRATLSRMTSPTQATLKVVCDIDDYRGGDVINLLGLGTLGGLWLVGDCNRSAFDPWSTLTLVKGAMPLSAATGESIAPSLAPTKTAAKPGSGTVIWRMVSYAMKLNNDNYPYVWGGGHARAGFASTGKPGGNGYNGVTKGFDCSGAVGAVLAAGNVEFTFGQSTLPTNDGIIEDLQSAGLLLSGQGTGPIEVTLFNHPGVHIFMRLNGSYFGTEDGSGHLPSNGFGVGWIKDGVDPTAGSGFTAYHLPDKVLRSYITGPNAQSAITGGE